MQSVIIGQEGELLISGPSVFASYLGRDELVIRGVSVPRSRAFLGNGTERIPN